MKTNPVNKLLYFLLFMLVACNKNNDQTSNPNPPSGTDPLTPIINSFGPPSAIPGSEIMIQGSDFSAILSENIVKFNGTQGVVVNGSTSFLIAKIPVGATTGKISVTVGTKTGFSATELIVINFSNLTITGISPASGKPGDIITISGANFFPDISVDTVRFNGAQANVISATPFQLVVKVPAGASTGNVTVKIQQHVATSPSPFSLVDAQVTTLAGNGQMNSVDGSGVAASFSHPKSIDIDGSGNLIIADLSSNKIRKLTPAGVATTIVTLSNSNSEPTGLKLDGAGNIFVVDDRTNRILKINPAGVESVFYSGQLNSPDDLVIDASGTVYVTDLFNHRVCKITASGNFSVVAGSDTSQTFNGVGLASRFIAPKGIAMDNAGNLFVSDLNTIRKITPAGVVTTYAGSTQGYANGPTSSALFNNIWGLNFDNAGNLYVAEINRVRKISAGGIVSTVAGGNLSGFADGPGTSARFDGAISLVVDAAGNIYVADGGNNRIRKIVE